MSALVDRTVRPRRRAALGEGIPGGAPGRAARRVLVADPCPDTVETTAWLLRLWGHDVRGAATGPDVLALARAYRPDAVLMEVALPGLSGFEVARRLRRPGADPRPLLVAVTGYGDETNRRRAREAGFDYHLLKPVEIPVLRALLALDPGETESGARQAGGAG